jgi:hypothetical protein
MGECGLGLIEIPEYSAIAVPFFWTLRRQQKDIDESLEDSANLPDPDIIAAEIVEDLQAALAQFAEIANDLKR